MLWLVLESGSSLVEMIYLGPEAILFVGQKSYSSEFWESHSPDLLIFILFKSSIIECLMSCDSECVGL